MALVRCILGKLLRGSLPFLSPQIIYLETIHSLNQFKQRNIPVTTGQNVMVVKHTFLQCYRYAHNRAVGAVAALSWRNVRN